MECVLCRAGASGEEAVDSIITGKRTPSQIAAEYGMKVDEVMEHVYEHAALGVVNGAQEGLPGEARPQGLTSLDFYSSEIVQILAYLKRYARGLSIHQSSGSKDVELSLKVMRELRLTIESLAEFQGRLATRTHTTINIDTMNMRYLSITNAIRTELCPTCRQKMLTIITNEASEETNPPAETITPRIISNT